MPSSSSAREHVPSRPSIRPERDFSLLNSGCIVAGIDEAGRGPLAGPVVAACVVWEFDAKRPVGIADSKQLTAEERDRLYRQITRKAAACGVGIASNKEIDLLNILEATRLASFRAFEECALRLGEQRIGAIVTDFLQIPAIGLPTLSLVKGDCKSASVASASIIAKVTRDRMMDDYHEEFPNYGWNSNRGYSTPDHYAALALHGPTSLHRMTFNGVGFFDEEPIRSASYLRFSNELAAMNGNPNRLLSLRDEVCKCRPRLPPSDFELLLHLVDTQLSSCA